MQCVSIRLKQCSSPSLWTDFFYTEVKHITGCIMIITQFKYFKCFHNYWFLSVLFPPVIWVLLGMGDTKCKHTSTEWQQVYWNECIQRGHNVYYRSCCLLPHQRPAKRPVLYCGSSHHILQYDYTLSSFCAKGKLFTGLFLYTNSFCHAISFILTAFNVQRVVT